jgi:hypothetical protein
MTTDDDRLLANVLRKMLAEDGGYCDGRFGGSVFLFLPGRIGIDGGTDITQEECEALIRVGLTLDPAYEPET